MKTGILITMEYVRLAEEDALSANQLKNVCSATVVMEITKEFASHADPIVSIAPLLPNVSDAMMDLGIMTEDVKDVD